MRREWVALFEIGVLGCLGCLGSCDRSPDTGRTHRDLLEREDRLRSIEQRLSQLESRLDSASGGVPPSRPTESAPATRDVLDRLEILEARVVLGQRAVDDQLARTVIALEELARRTSGGGTLDSADRDRIRREVEDESKIAFEERLREMQQSNREARAHWISEVSGEMGLTQGQRDAIVGIYEAQSSRWAQIFAGSQHGPGGSSRMSEELRQLRRDTDRELKQYLTADQIQQFRELEASRFGQPAPR